MKIWISSLWNSIRNRKEINTLKISAEADSLIFLLWEIACKKNASSSSIKQAARTAHLARFVMSREIGLLPKRSYKWM